MTREPGFRPRGAHLLVSVDEGGQPMEALLTTAEVAALLRVAPETLRYWR